MTLDELEDMMATPQVLALCNILLQASISAPPDVARGLAVAVMEINTLTRELLLGGGWTDQPSDHLTKVLAGVDRVGVLH